MRKNPSRIGCIAILVLMSIPALYEIAIIRLNMWKVQQMCRDTTVPEIFDRVRWNAWSRDLDKAGAAIGVNWAVGPTREQIAPLQKLAKDRGYYEIGYNGYPYLYPFNRVLVPRTELYQNGLKIGAITKFITYSDVGPILSSIAGGGKIYSCSDGYNKMHNLAAFKEIGFMFVNINNDFTWGKER